MDRIMTSERVRRLLGSMTLVDFNSQVREQATRQFERAFEAELLADLFDLSALEMLLASDAMPATYIDVITNGLPKRLADLQRSSGKAGLELVADSVRRGATIRVSDIQRFHGGLGSFTREIAAYFAAQVQINAYLTPPGHVGFNPHFDTTDIFIVQCVGAKEWKIFGDYTGRLDLPLLETPWAPELYLPSPEFEALTLKAGDVLYLPRGVMHQARCNDQASLHLTISLAPLTPAEVLTREIKRLIEEDVELRKRIDWSIGSDAGHVSQLNATLRKLLLGLADRLDLAGLLAAEELRLQRPPVSEAGELQAAIASLDEAAGRATSPRTL